LAKRPAGIVLNIQNIVLSAPMGIPLELSRSRCRCIQWSSARPLFREGMSHPETDTHQSPIWLKAVGERPSLQPLAHLQPQKIFGTRPCPNKAITTNMVLPALLWLTAWAIKMLKRIKEVERRTNQPFWVNQRLLWFSVPAPFSLRK